MPPVLSCPVLSLLCACLCTAAVFKAQSFYDMVERLWQAMFDLLLRMSNIYRRVPRSAPSTHVHVCMRAVAHGSSTRK